MSWTCCNCAISSIQTSSTPQLSSIKLINTKNYHANGAAACVKLFRIKASMVESSHDSSAKRMERAWLISKQPRPVSCSSCESNGHVDCKWCGGTGFFIIGDNMLCQVPSRNTSCVICAGKGSTLL